MKTTEAKVTDAELAVLKALWEQGGSTIRELTDKLYPGGGTSQYATVQKLLERLESKSCVARESSSRAHRFRALVAVDELIDQTLRETAARLCEGSLTPLLTHLVQSRTLKQAELQELRRLVDKLDEGQN